MKLPLPGAILTTVAYADIFDYPLTWGELTTWLAFGDGKVRGVQARSQVREVAVVDFNHQEYVCLQGRERLLVVRRRRQRWTYQKWQIAKSMGGMLLAVPTLKLVGVTGALAMDNTRGSDDIDLFFITNKRTLWLTRVLVTVLVELSGRRRRPGDIHIRDKVCLNMFMTEDALSLPARERDLFTAHEVLQMQPLWERDEAYRKFLAANSWVKHFLPNAWKEKLIKIKAPSTKHQVPSNFKIINSNNQTMFRIWDLVLRICLEFGIWCLRFIEPLAKKIQLWYMRSHRTTEVVTDTVIRFHPRDARAWVKEALAKRLMRYNLPLDKIFYGR